MDLVRVDHVTFNHESRTVFNDVSLNIETGKITAILGPSGTGKTTLLKLITGYLKPEQGEIYFKDHRVSHAREDDLFKLRQEMGFLFQSSALFTNHTVYDNVAFPMRELTPLSESLIRTIVLMNLEAVGLRGARDLYPSQLSGGMARRVALARALVLDPQLMLYDEPFTGQDPISMGVLLKLIKTLNEQLNMTSIVVSHDVQEALSIADWAYVIVDGKVLARGSSKDFIHSDLPQLQQFLRGLPDGPVPFHYPCMGIDEDLLC